MQNTIHIEVVKPTLESFLTIIMFLLKKEYAINSKLLVVHVRRMERHTFRALKHVETCTFTQ